MEGLTLPVKHPGDFAVRGKRARRSGGLAVEGPRGRPALPPPAPDHTSSVPTAPRTGVRSKPHSRLAVQRKET